MRKIISIILCAILVMALAPATLAEGTYEIAMVTDVGNIDDQSFNQYTWEATKQYAEENGKTYAYYRPKEDSTDSRVEAITAAIDKGAKVIVCPGYLFIETIEIAQEMYPEVNFLFIDYDMADGAAANTHCIIYKEEQAGFLAGYAAVKDGYKNLGFLGGIAVPAVIRYGEGFVQGAEVAAAELGISDINVKYWYSGTFAPSDEIKAKMAGWITDGTEVIFACGGGVVFSALQAAREGGAKIIGVDVDQSNLDELVITSAMKELGNSVLLSLKALYDNNGVWPEDLSAKTAVLGAAEDCVGLPTAEGSWRFNAFTLDEYNALFEKIKSGEVAISDAIDVHPTVANLTVDYQE